MGAALAFFIGVFSGMSWAADSERGRGAILTPPALKALIPVEKPKAIRKGSKPQEVDLSNRFPSPRDQGPIGTCVAWAVAYYKTFLEGDRRYPDRNADAHIVSPAFIYNQIGDRSTCEGSSYFDAFSLLKSTGAVSLAEFPYDRSNCSDVPDDSVKRNARNWRIRGWRQADFNDREALKTFLANGLPVAVAVASDDAFEKHRSEAVFDSQGGAVRGSHAVVVVGYSESRQAFRILNSWGRDWGDGGYAWISYRLFSLIAKEAWVAADESEDLPVSIEGINDDAFEVISDKAADLGVLKNDTLADLANPKISVLVAPEHGELIVNNGKARYVPMAGYVGNDQFYYKVEDAAGKVGVAKVSLMVRDAAAVDEEAEAWKEAKASGQEDAIRAFRKAYPNGRYRAEASRLLLSLKIKGVIKKKD